MLSKKWVRLLIGFLLGGAAGLSLASSVIPTAVSTLVADTDTFFVRYILGEHAGPTAVIWAIGGWAIGRVGHVIYGAIILGVVGLATGIFLCYAALGMEAGMLATTLFTSTFYGTIGGMMLGHILQAPPDNANA